MLGRKDFGAAVLEPSFAPVDVPIGGFAARKLRGFERSLADLVETLPATSRQRRRKARDPEFDRTLRGRTHAYAEARPAASSAFGFVFESPHGLQPPHVIVVAVDERHADFFAVPHALLLAHEVLLGGEDVRVEVKDGRRVVVLKEPLENGARARGAAAVKKNGFGHRAFRARPDVPAEGKAFECGKDDALPTR